MEKIKTLIFGLGRIAWKLEEDPLRMKPCTHAGVLLNPEMKQKFELVGAYDKDPEKIEQFFHWSGCVTQCVETNKKEVWKEKPDLVIIATNPASHFKYLYKAIEEKVPLILVEKPALKTRSQYLELQKLNKRSQSKIWVNHERRYHPVYKRIKTEIEIAKQSAPVRMHGRLAVQPSSGKLLQESSLFHDGTHLIDLALWYFGDPIKVEKIQKSKNYISFLLQFGNHHSAILEISSNMEYFQFEIDIHTKSKRIIAGNGYYSNFQTEESTYYKGFKSLKKSEISPGSDEQQNPWMNLYDEIAGAHSNPVRMPTSPIEDSFCINTIMKKLWK